MPPTYPRPPALLIGLACAVMSVVAAIAESGLLLVTRGNMRDTAESMGNTSLRTEAEEFGSVILVGVFGSLTITVIIVVSLVVAVLGKSAGRVMMFVATGIATGWNMFCGCILTAPSIAATSESANEVTLHYTEVTHILAVLCGFTAGVLAIVAIVCLAQRSVGKYFRGQAWT